MTVTKCFPDDPKNKVFIVDVYVTLCKTFRVEAKNKDEAEAGVTKFLQMARATEPDDTKFIQNLADSQFHDAEELDIKCSGEYDENGEEKFY